MTEVARQECTSGMTEEGENNPKNHKDFPKQPFFSPPLAINHNIISILLLYVGVLRFLED